MSNTWFTADTHLSHAAMLRHCHATRPYSSVDEMDKSIVDTWNQTVSRDDLVYVIGDFAWSNHRKWINELNGKKILVVGNHDKMPQDALDLFKPDWICEDMTAREAIKTMVQFREVHQKLVRVICGQMMTLNHEPMRSWSSSVHGSICLCGHSHGRCLESRPGEIGGGLMLDVGWDIWHNPISFDEVMRQMRIKLEKMPQNFRDHVLKGTKLTIDTNLD